MLGERIIYLFEAQHEPILGRWAFVRRMAAFFVIAGLVVGPSLIVGAVGFHYLEGVAWINAFTDAAMTLSGMGPFTPANTTAGKIFAALYALYSGLVFIVVAGIILAPIAHRILHRFHLEEPVE